MEQALGEAPRAAQSLFAPLGPTYDRYARVLSFGQDPRWRSFLVSRVEAAAGQTVLDVASGTGAVAIELARRYGCSVVGIDQSAEMLAAGRRRVASAGVADLVRLQEGRAESLPFADQTFDAVTFTYLLRYVDDPGTTLRELSRVLRPGGTLASLEFFVPPNAAARAAWELYVRAGLPLAGRVVSAGMGARRPIPRAEHPKLLRASAAPGAACALACRGDRRATFSPSQPGRRDRGLGDP